jgi:hypothetical protein
MSIIDIFNNAMSGSIFAKGSAPDSPKGLHMTGSGKTLYWVAVKGYADDWSVYCGWEDDPVSLRNFGDKVCGKENILRVVPADGHMMAKYRY